MTPASVLTLWATVVAERLDYPPDLALTLGQAVAASRPRSKAHNLAVVRSQGREVDQREQEAALAPQTVRLLGQQIRLVVAEDGELRAADNGKPASASTVEAHLQQAFGKNLSEVWATMTAMAATIPPDVLNRIGIDLYEYFRPDVPSGDQGTDEKGLLMLGQIEAAGAAGADPAIQPGADPPTPSADGCNATMTQVVDAD